MTAGETFYSPAQWRAFIASIIAAVHLDIDKLARLTDRQLVEIYAHPRDENGSIKSPEETLTAPSAGKTPPSLERDLRDLAILAATLRMPESAYKAAEEKLRAKWAAKTEESPNG